LFGVVSLIAVAAGMSLVYKMLTLAAMAERGGRLVDEGVPGHPDSTLALHVP